MIEKLIQRVQKTQHGFLDIQKTADEVFAGHAAKESLRFAKQLFTSNRFCCASLPAGYVACDVNKIEKVAKFWKNARPNRRSPK